MLKQIHPLQIKSEILSFETKPYEPTDQHHSGLS